MFNDYENQDTTKDYVHVMGWVLTEEQFTKFIPVLMKRIRPFIKDISFFYMPSNPSELTGFIGARFNLLCRLDKHSEVLSAVDNINF